MSAVATREYRMKTSAVMVGRVLNDGQVYELPEALGEAFVAANQAARVGADLNVDRVPTKKYRMNTSAVTPWTVLNEGQVYDLPDELGEAFVAAAQATRVDENPKTDEAPEHDQDPERADSRSKTARKTRGDSK